MSVCVCINSIIWEMKLDRCLNSKLKTEFGYLVTEGLVNKEPIKLSKVGYLLIR